MPDKFINAKRKENITWVDFALLGSVALVCFLLLGCDDIFVTAENSFSYLRGHIFDFYSDTHTAGIYYSANYMPTTYILFAIWNLPLMLFGLPPYRMQHDVFTLTWIKLMPLVFFVLAGYILFRIVKEEFHFSVRKSKYAVIAFFTMPMAFYSQFLFIQQDAIYVFCVLCGFYFYLKSASGEQNLKNKNWALFLLCFAVTITLKTFSLLIFGVLLVLKEKRILHIIWNAVLGMSLYAVQFLFYYIFDRDSFIKSCLDFPVTQNATRQGIDFGVAFLQFFPLFLCVLLFACYLTKPKDKQEWISYSLFYVCGVCFALFGLMVWHPQWLMLGAPFWILSTFINKNHKIFFVLEALAGIVLALYTIFLPALKGITDNHMLLNGILSPWLRYHDYTFYDVSATMQFSQLNAINYNLLFTALIAFFLVNFIFKHPKFAMEDWTEELDLKKGLLHLRMAAVAIPCLVILLSCIPAMAKTPVVIWERIYGSEEHVIVCEPGETISQKVFLPEGSINMLQLLGRTENGEVSGAAEVTLRTSLKGDVLAKKTVVFSENAPWSDCEIGEIIIPERGNYFVEIKNIEKETGLVFYEDLSPYDNHWMGSVVQDYTDIELYEEDVRVGKSLALRILKQ